MTADLFDALVAMTAIGSLAMLGVLMLRTALRRWFGAQVAYAAWLAVPLVTGYPGNAVASVEVGEPGEPRFRLEATLALLKSKVSDQEASEDVSYQSWSPPSYPASALKAHLSGEVLLRVQVSAAGEPESATVVRVEPPEATALSDAAIEAVLQWHFKPAARDGVAIAGEVEVPFKFTLEEDDVPAATPQKAE